MKIVFAGTPEFAIAPLMKLASAQKSLGFTIEAVLTQPDKPQGRKGILTPSPVKRMAEELGIPVLQPERLKSDFAALAAVGADLMITCAYGQILTQPVLDLFPQGVWNIHASLLPAYRGAAPIPRVIIDGEQETGVTIMKTDIGLDTGDILLKSEPLPITQEHTADSLSHELSGLGAVLIVFAMQKIIGGNINLTKQPEGGFVCKKVQRTQVDFAKPAEEVSRLIRGLSAQPGSFGVIGGLTLNFFHAQVVEGEANTPAGTVISDSPKRGFVVQCAEGAVRITDLQPAGGKRMTDAAFLNGRKVTKGMAF